MRMAGDSQYVDDSYVSRSVLLSSCGAGFTGADPDRLFELADKYASVPGTAGARDIGYGFEHRFDDGVIHCDFDFGSRPELGFVNLGHSDTLDPQLSDRLPQLVQLEWPHDGSDHFHEVHFAMIEP
jgi:hypothetical protein